MIFFSDKQQECDLPIYGGGGGHSDAIQSSLTSGATPSTGCNIIHYYVYQLSKKLGSLHILLDFFQSKSLT